MLSRNQSNNHFIRQRDRVAKLIFGRLIDQLSGYLEHELVGHVDTVLDLGCGSDSPVGQFKDRLERTVGVELFENSLDASRAKGLHNEYIQMDVLAAAEHFGENSFDCVIAIDLIEHLKREDGLRLIEQMETMATKKSIIFTPNGFVPQTSFDGNEWQHHRSGWEIEEMQQRGYRVIGINGWKRLRGERAKMKWRPKTFWTVVSLISELVTTRNPQNAYQILCIKDIEQAH